TSLLEVPDPASDRARAATLTVARLLATAVTDPSFESAAASALLTELLDFAAACRLDYASALVAESVPAGPPSVGGECALGTDVLEDRQEDFECLAAAVPRFASMLLAPEGDSDTPDIPTPRSYAEAITAYPSLFLHTDTSLSPFYVLVYVDDLVFATADTEALTLVKSKLQKRHTCTDLGELRSYLGLQITWDRARRTITVTQSHLVRQVLQCFGFQFSSPQPTPLSTSHSLSAPPSDESVEPSGPYPELVGCLIYLMTCTQSDLITSGMGLVLGGRGPVVLTGHADASWVDDSATQRSSQGYTFSLGSGSISWRSTRSSSVLSSSCEAEIYTGAMAAQELHWLTYLLIDLGEQPRSPPVLYVDNKAMIALCQEHILEHRTKHIALRYFLARELQQRGQLRLAYVATRANTADVFTKALPPRDHQRFVTVLGLPVAAPTCHVAAPIGRVAALCRPRRCPQRPCCRPCRSRRRPYGRVAAPAGRVATPAGRVAAPAGPVAALRDLCGRVATHCRPRRRLWWPCRRPCQPRRCPCRPRRCPYWPRRHPYGPCRPRRRPCWPRRRPLPAASSPLPALLPPLRGLLPPPSRSPNAAPMRPYCRPYAALSPHLRGPAAAPTRPLSPLLSRPSRRPYAALLPPLHRPFTAPSPPGNCAAEPPSSTAAKRPNHLTAEQPRSPATRAAQQPSRLAAKPPEPPDSRAARAARRPSRPAAEPPEPPSS
ncbi:unnamed protein product, partial [Closterium sp. NIES-54]